MFWGTQRLKSELPSLISDFSESRLDRASYRLRVGSEFYVSVSDGYSSSLYNKSATFLNKGERIEIPSGQFGFLLTEERVQVPDKAIAFISIRAKYKFRGLVNVSGFHVDPLYTGQLIFSVFNAGPRTVHLSRGEDCFLIWYADLDEPSEMQEKRGFKSIPSGVTSFVSDGLHSFSNIDKRLQSLEKHISLIKLFGASAIALIVFVAITVYRFIPTN